MAINSYTPSLSVAGVSSQNPNSSYYNPLQFTLGKTTTDITRLYIKFDLSTFPTEYNIVNATLNIPVISFDPSNQNKVVIYTVTNSADFSTMTWNNMAEFDSYPNYDAAVTSNYISIDITTLVLSWIDKSVPNYGMILLNNEVYFTTATLNTNVYAPNSINVLITYISNETNSFFRSFSFPINNIGSPYISNSFDFGLYRQISCFINNFSTSPVELVLESSPNNIDFVVSSEPVTIQPNSLGFSTPYYFAQYIRAKLTTTEDSIIGNGWFQVQQ